MANKFWQGVNNILKSTVPVYDKVEQAVDEHIRDTVTPIRGSIIYCNFDIILQSVAEHTGIYIGNGQIVELQGKTSGGQIRAADRHGFFSGTGASHVSVACHGNGSQPIGSEEIARRAESQIGNSRNYHLFKDNCHRFTSGCITGNFDNGDTQFLKLCNTIRRHFGNFNWRAWK